MLAHEIKEQKEKKDKKKTKQILIQTVKQQKSSFQTRTKIKIGVRDESFRTSEYNFNIF